MSIQTVTTIDPGAIGPMLSTTLDQMVAALSAGLDGGADVELASLDILDDASSDLVLRTWNDTAAAVPDRSVAGLFEQRAAPGRTRLRWWPTGSR